MSEKQEIQEQIQDLRKEIRDLREEVREVKAIMAPVVALFRGNGFKQSIALLSSGIVIAVYGAYCLFAKIGIFLVQLVKAFRG